MGSKTTSHFISVLLFFVFFLVFVVFSPSPTLANEKFWQWEHLTGNWWGLRDTLSEKGLSFEFIYSGEITRNLSGGIDQKTEYLSNIDLTLTLDAEKLMHWKGATFFLYGLGNYGGNPSDHVGDAQTVSNIEAPATWKLYEAWFQQNLFHDRLSILLGLYDLNAEFNTLETAGLFLNSTHGISTDQAQAGKNGPSIFPTTSLAARMRLNPHPNLYFQTAIFDGVSGDPNNPNGTQVKFSSGDGLMITSEIGYTQNTEPESSRPYAKLALGAWYFTGKFEDLVEIDGNGDPLLHLGNYGIYLMGEYTLFRENADTSQGLASFLRLGWAKANVNPFQYYVGAGLVYTGAIPTRDEDQIGIAMATSFASSKYKTLSSHSGTPASSAEINLEFTYRAKLTPWLAIQPDLQYVIHPSALSDIKNALYFATRFEISF